MYTILKKNGVEAENSDGSLNYLVLERTAELAVHMESLQIETEVLGKQKEPVGEQQGSGLASETRNLLHDGGGKQTRLDGELPPCPAPLHRCSLSGQGRRRAGGGPGIPGQCATKHTTTGFAWGYRGAFSLSSLWCSICLLTMVVMPLIS